MIGCDLPEVGVRFLYDSKVSMSTEVWDKDDKARKVPDFQREENEEKSFEGSEEENGKEENKEENKKIKILADLTSLNFHTAVQRTA